MMKINELSWYLFILSGPVWIEGCSVQYGDTFMRTNYMDHNDYYALITTSVCEEVTTKLQCAIRCMEQATCVGKWTLVET